MDLQAMEEIKMSKWCRELFKGKCPTMDELRIALRPKFPTDENGLPVYVTEQDHKNECDINTIIAKYDQTGLITHVSHINASYGDVSQMDFREAIEKVQDIRTQFDQMPSEIRKFFENDPGNLLGFMSDPANRPKAIELGLIRNDWTDETDGIGERVPLGGNVIKANTGQPDEPKQ